MVGRVLLQVPASLLYCAMPHWAILGEARWSPPLRSLLFSSPTVASSTATPR